MKLPLGLVLLLWAPTAVWAADTAYSALRVVGKQQGADALNRVLEVRGRGGSPAPVSWKVVLSDPSARGGLRETDIQRGRIVSERTPVSRGPTQPINFNQLNLDSDGAFTVANQEAQKVPVTFDRVDYALQGGGRGPLWHLELFEGSSPVGSVDIAADNGAVIHRSLGRHAPPMESRTYQPDDRRGPPPPPPSREYREDYSRRDYPPQPPDYARGDDQYGDDNRGLAQKFTDHFTRRGSQIKRFFLGGD